MIVKAGRFREDLFARINLWTFFLPSLIERSEDIEPNLDYELVRFAQENNVTIRFNKEAKEKYLELCYLTNCSLGWELP